MTISSWPTRVENIVDKQFLHCPQCFPKLLFIELPTRKALQDVVQNKSRLPTPGSKLKAPTKVVKRSRSPVEAPSAKRQRISQENPIKKPGTGTKLRPSNSTGSLNKVGLSSSHGPGAGRHLNKQTSGGNLKNAAVKSGASRGPSSKPPLKPGNTSNSATNGTAAPKAGGGKKRPAWDLKGRLQDMEEEMQRKNEQMTKWSEIMGNLENSNKQLSGSAAENQQMFNSVNKEKTYLQDKLAEAETEVHTLKLKLERETENFEFTKASLRRQKDALETQLNEMQTNLTRLQTTITQITSAHEILKTDFSAIEISLNRALNDNKDKDAEIAELRAFKEEYEEKFRIFETERRQLHNTIQELKGNIRVFCRVRPLLGEELIGNDGEIQHMNFPDDDHKTVELEKLGDISLSETIIQGTKRSGNGRYTFSFDRVFLPESTQSDVFEEISQLVQSALDGYNVCIFAYGQTGSGKTYTMEGPSVEDEDTMGMISRATIQIFRNTKDLEDKGWQYEFEASFLEIYNETIRDLLSNHGPNVKHDIKLGPGGKDVIVTNLTTQQVTRREQIITLLRTASKNRAVGETICNERSSRSHSVFRLKITGSNDITGESCAGTLNLIDLAGSERLKESGATGQRLKETQNINKSLANLGNVIMALGNKDPHVPYRNSKLTYLLQNSLGGNSKTLMFVNVSPRDEHFSETVNSLRFATKVNQCNIGTATKKSKV